jgi:hypothetical protein
MVRFQGRWCQNTFLGKKNAAHGGDIDMVECDDSYKNPVQTGRAFSRSEAVPT